MGTYICTHHVYKTQSCISHYQAKCYMTAVLIQHHLPETARLLYVYMQIQCHLIFLCCCCSLINNLILQASQMWQHFCHIVMYFLCRPPWDSSTWMWLWWHTIILPVKRIRMPDLLHVNELRLLETTTTEMAQWPCGAECSVCACMCRVCGFMTVY